MSRKPECKGALMMSSQGPAAGAHLLSSGGTCVPLVRTQRLERRGWAEGDRVSKETARESTSHVLEWDPYPWAASMCFPGGQTARSKFLSQMEAQEN